MIIISVFVPVMRSDILFLQIGTNSTARMQHDEPSRAARNADRFRRS
jgi:hypothetical protein